MGGEENNYFEDNNLVSIFVNTLSVRIKHVVIKNHEFLSQIYTDLGVLGNDDQTAQFWWVATVNALKEFAFGNLCRVIPNRAISNNIYFICESGLRTLLLEKGIPEDSYSIDYGTMYCEKIFIVGNPVDDMERIECKKQYQKGLRISRKPQKRP